MLLAAEHLAALNELAGTGTAVPAHPWRSAQAAPIYRELKQEGLARHPVGHDWVLTPAGNEAQRLLSGMLANGLLLPTALVPPGWRFLDDEMLAALRAAARNDDRVAMAAAPPLLARGLAELREELDDLRLFVAPSVYGRAWLELAGRLQAEAIRRCEPEVPLDALVGGALHEMQPISAYP
jgi:hypothetical protein